jgi:2-(1,2-epoxy-1,2-dihydrophenyl)acetyl-CoA isomerase
MSECFIRYEKHDRIALLTMNRPDSRNAIGTHQDCDDFIAALGVAQSDAAVSCIILTGAGAAFSAGGDLKAIHA